MELCLIRHGMTRGNLEHRYVGRTDEPLDDGCREALLDGRVRLRAGEQAGQPVLGVYMSPMLRCLETADLLFPEERYPDAERIVVPGLTECDFGEFEYRTYGELSGHPAYEAFLARGWIPGFPGGETTDGFRKRSCRAFQRCLETAFAAGKGNGDGTLVFVVHGGTIMSVMEAFAVPKKEYYSWQVKNLEGFSMKIRREEGRVFGFCLTDVARFRIL